MTCHNLLQHLLPCPECGKTPQFSHKPSSRAYWEDDDLYVFSPAGWTWTHDCSSNGLRLVGVYAPTLRAARQDWQETIRRWYHFGTGIGLTQQLIPCLYCGAQPQFTETVDEYGVSTWVGHHEGAGAPISSTTPTHRFETFPYARTLREAQASWQQIMQREYETARIKLTLTARNHKTATDPPHPLPRLLPCPYCGAQPEITNRWQLHHWCRNVPSPYGLILTTTVTDSLRAAQHEWQTIIQQQYR